ncbi:MAG: alkaline phosphatase [bacterium]
MRKPSSVWKILSLLAGAAWLARLSLGCRSQAVLRDDPAANRVRNVILVIGDGMGPQQIALANLYARHAPHSVVPDRRLHLDALMNEGQVGLSSTEPADGLVNDSAGSATQIATALPSRPGMIGVDASGNRAETVLEKAKRAGYATGLVSNVRITDATPAAFAAHRPYRYQEPEIAEDLLAAAPDVMLSGGLRSFLPAQVNEPGSAVREAWRARLPASFRLESRRADERDLVAQARDLGYAVVFDGDGLAGARGARLLGLFASGAMPDALAMRRARAEPGRSVPTMVEMTRAALERLASSSKGFFLMVEAGGQIDWAGHDNDAGDLLQEMLDFDETLGAIRAWMDEHPETLLVVTADHETGSFGFSYSRWQIPGGLALAGATLGGKTFQSEFNFGDPAVLDQLHEQRQSFGELLDEFDTLPESERTPATLRERFNALSRFPITIQDAATVLATEPNTSYVPGHRYLDEQTFPRVRDFKEFYVDPPRARAALLGRAIARQQGIVWGTGTHTSTLVLAIAAGPPAWTRRFAGLHHETEIGRVVAEALALD